MYTYCILRAIRYTNCLKKFRCDFLFVFICLLASTQTVAQSCDDYLELLINNSSQLLRNISKSDRKNLYVPPAPSLQQQLVEGLKRGELPAVDSVDWPTMPHLALRAYLEGQINLNEMTAVTLYWQTNRTIGRHTNERLERKALLNTDGSLTHVGQVLLELGSDGRRLIPTEQFKRLIERIQNSSDAIDRFVHVVPFDLERFHDESRRSGSLLAAMATLAQLQGSEMMFHLEANRLLDQVDLHGIALVSPTLNQLQWHAQAVMGSRALQLSPELGPTSRESILEMLGFQQRPLGIHLPGISPGRLVIDGVSGDETGFTMHDLFHTIGSGSPSYNQLSSKVGLAMHRLAHSTLSYKSVNWPAEVRKLLRETVNVHGRGRPWVDTPISRIVDLQYFSDLEISPSQETVVADKLIADYGSFDQQAYTGVGLKGLQLLHMVAEPAAYNQGQETAESIAKAMGPKSESLFHSLSQDSEAVSVLRAMMGIDP